MLKGVLFRQVFLVVDLALAVLIAFVAYLFLMKVFEHERIEGGGEQEAVASENAAGFTKLKSRADYDAIVASNLFGPAARSRRPSEEVQPAAQVEVAETQLRLRLLGTSTTDSFLTSAVIFNEDMKRSETFFIGDDVVAGVSLEEVHEREVILFNVASNRREVLRMEEDGATAKAPGRAGRPRFQPPAPNRTSTQIRLSRAEVFKDLTENYAEIEKTLDPVPYRDEKGKVVGYTSKNIGKLPLAGKLGLKDGDVVQSVNGVAIDSEEKIFEVAQKFQNSKTFRFGILRGGRTHTITYSLY